MSKGGKYLEPDFQFTAYRGHSTISLIYPLRTPGGSQGFPEQLNKEGAQMASNSFDRLVQAGLILSPEAFSDEEKKHIEKLTSAEVDALISVRGKLGNEFLEKKTSQSAGRPAAMAIVF